MSRVKRHTNRMEQEVSDLCDKSCGKLQQQQPKKK